MNRKPLPWSSTKCPHCLAEESTMDNHDRKSCRAHAAAAALDVSVRVISTTDAKQRIIERLRCRPPSRGELLEFFHDDRSAVTGFLKHLASGDKNVYHQLFALIEGGKEPIKCTFPETKASAASTATAPST